MKIKYTHSCLLITIIIFNCSGIKKAVFKKEQSLSMEARIPFMKCNSPVELNDKKDQRNSLKDLDSLSFSIAYTSIDTYHANRVSDSLKKNEIRYFYAHKIKELVGGSFSKISFVNDSVLLNKDYDYINKSVSNIIYNKGKTKPSIDKISLNQRGSNKQLFINIHSFFFKAEFKNYVAFFVFDLKEKQLLYLDRMDYKCDIRDYNSLEKVVLYGLSKLKQNFE